MPLTVATVFPHHCECCGLVWVCLSLILSQYDRVILYLFSQIKKIFKSNFFMLYVQKRKLFFLPSLLFSTVYFPPDHSLYMLPHSGGVFCFLFKSCEVIEAWSKQNSVEQTLSETVSILPSFGQNLL